MGVQNYITETEAAELAGVTVNTLNRFAEAGYLEIEVDVDDGLRMYSRSQLESLFGITQPLSRRGTAQTEQAAEAQAVNASTTVAPNDATPASEAPGPPEQPTNVVQMPRQHEPDEPSRPAGQFARDTESMALRALELELSKLKNIIDLQEKLLDMRDQELHDLRRQRTWLESRVERLEEKSEREQLLLLSEAQMVRQLISMQERRSPIRGLLEWFGVSRPQATASTTIEFPHSEDKKPNQD